MNHHNKTRKFGRKKNQRNALMKSLALALIKHGSITTTFAKAKSLRPYVEKMITKAKTGESLASLRLLSGRLGNTSSAKVLIEKIAPKYKTRNGGYTRIVKAGERKLDGSKMAVIEFVD